MAKLVFITDDGQPRGWVWYAVWTIALISILIAGAFTDAVALRLEKLIAIYVTILPIIIGAEVMKTRAVMQKKLKQIMYNATDEGTTVETESEGGVPPGKIKKKTSKARLKMTEDMLGGEDE